MQVTQVNSCIGFAIDHSTINVVLVLLLLLFTHSIAIGLGFVIVYYILYVLYVLHYLLTSMACMTNGYGKHYSKPSLHMLQVCNRRIKVEVMAMTYRESRLITIIIIIITTTIFTVLSSTVPAICESSLWFLWAKVGQRLVAANP